MGKRRAYVDDDYAASGPIGGMPIRREPVMDERLLERLHKAILATASNAVAQVAHMDPERAEADIVKRIVKSAYKAASEPSLLLLSWDQACEEVVSRMMQGYSSAFGEAPWFFCIDLPPVLCAACWEVMRGAQGPKGGKGAPGRPSPGALQGLVTLAYEDKLDRILLDKAMWEVTVSAFIDERVQNKVFQAISRSYWPALDEVLGPVVLQEELQGALSPAQELKHVEAFARRWMDDAMCRAWVSIEQAEEVLTKETVEHLFLALVAPFGADDPFSCMPRALMEQIGRPPVDWPFVAQAVEDLFASWGRQASGGGGASSRKKRKTGGGTLAEQEEETDAIDKFLSKAKPKAAPQQRSMIPTAKRLPGSAGAVQQKRGGQQAKVFTPSEPYLRPTALKARTKFKGFLKSKKEEEEEEQAEEPGGEAEEEEEAEEGAAEDEEEAEEEAAAGHPRCTSDEDCIGSPECHLIQHYIGGKPGDIYCESCWESFARRNPTLEGVPVTD